MDSDQQEAWPIYCASGKNNVYLVMIHEGTRLKVIPTELGRQKLNGRLWPLWLQTLLLTKSSPKLTYGVGLSGKYLYVSSQGSLTEMKYTVSSIGAQIRPLTEVLFPNEDLGMKFSAGWQVYAKAIPALVKQDAGKLELPSGADLTFEADNEELWLHRERSCRTSLGELKRKVELHFALCYSRSQVGA